MKNPLTFILCFVLSCLTLSAAPQLSNVVTSSTDAPSGIGWKWSKWRSMPKGSWQAKPRTVCSMHMLNEDDFLSSCSGDADDPMVLESTSGGWYNHPLNLGWNASGINPAAFATFPELAFDSYLTLGATASNGNHPDVRQATWTGPTNSKGPTPMGSNINTEGDVFGFLWFNLPDVNGDGTHSGCRQPRQPEGACGPNHHARQLSGQLTVQIFENGDPNTKSA